MESQNISSLQNDKYFRKLNFNDDISNQVFLTQDHLEFPPNGDILNMAKKAETIPKTVT